MTSQALPTSILKGVVAGAVGTLAMDLVWYSRYRRSGGDDSFTGWEFASSSVDSFEDAGAPAQVGKRMTAALGIELPDQRAGTTTDVVHWATGSQWGAAYGLAVALTDDRDLALGLALGPAAWATAYVLLGAAGIYEPIWTYDAKTLAKDLSAHLVFGGATALAFRALGPGRRAQRSAS